MGSKGPKDDFHRCRSPSVKNGCCRKLNSNDWPTSLPRREWFANLTNENTKRAYRNDVISFMRFVGIGRPEDFRSVTRAHVIAWRKVLQKRKLATATLRRKLSALSDLFDYLCEENAVTDNRFTALSDPRKVPTRERRRQSRMRRPGPCSKRLRATP